MYITRGNVYVMHFKQISESTNVLFLTPQSMASQPADVESSYVEIASFVRGYHDYQAVWQPSVGKVLLLQTEPTNIKDNKAIVFVKNTLVVGHVPAKPSVLFCQFMSRTYNKGTVEVTGAVVSRGAGYGMEVPCKSGMILEPMWSVCRK